MSYLGADTPIIHAGNYKDFIDPVIDGEKKLCRTKPRDYKRNPVGSFAFAAPFDLPLIDEGEWEKRLEQLTKAEARCSDLRMRGNKGKPIPSRDQNGKGYCWGHSGVSTCLVTRARQKQPYADLSAFSICCVIKNFKNQGGFGTQGIEYMAEHGCATSDDWPQKSMDKSHNNDKTWERAKRYKITEWMDLKPRNKKQLVTCLLNSIPVVVDFNWWSHSVCALDLVSVDPFRILIWNSWSDGWGNQGMGILEGNKAVPDGHIAPRVMRSSS